MKTKYLFYSLALAGAFAACSQEELIETPVVENDAANRPVAGVVEFSTEGVESRFNYEKANGFEKGDVFGLYLMDEFVNGDAIGQEGHKAEHKDANGTYWKYQNHWFGMYHFTNNIQSNYPFRYDGNGGWKNDAKLVEGNYFAMFPQNDLALNRRELWHAIDPSVELKKVSSSTSSNKKYQNVENQFWLGYKQIYRDETASAEGVMKMNLSLTGVMVPLKFVINNNSNNTVIVDKISFKSQLGKALPTLAYVKPENGMSYDAEYGWIEPTRASNEFVGCGSAVASYLYDNAAESETWTKQTIQNLVEWTVPGSENIPYGLTGAAAKAAYEYSFSYPEDVTLAPGVDGGSLLTTYIVIPAMENAPDYQDLQVCIYGWQKDNSVASGWSYGMLTPNKATDDDNYSFNLYELVNVWAQSEQAEETGYYRTVNVKFSEFAWKAVNQTIVSGTSEMEKTVESYLALNGGNVNLTIAPDANGVEITSEFLAMLMKDSKTNGRVINLTFSGLRGGKVTFNDNNTMYVNAETTETGDKVTLSYADGIQLINNGTQTVAGAISAPVENNGTLTVSADGSLTGGVDNYNVMAINGTVSNVNNLGTLTLKKGANVTTLNNNADGVAGRVIVDAYVNNNDKTATVGTFNNKVKDECGTCAPAELTVKTGVLSVTTLNNNAKLTVDKDATIAATTLQNNQHASGAHGWANVYALVNNGTITGEVVNDGIIDNYGLIGGNLLENNSTLNGYAGKVVGLKNSDKGVLYVKSTEIDVEANTSSEGTIVFEGVMNMHVDKIGGDKRVYRATESTTFTDLYTILSNIQAQHVWTAYDITLNHASETNKYAFISGITIEGANVKFTGGENKTYNFANATLEVLENCCLDIEGTITVEMLNRAEDAGEVHVGAGATLKIENDVNHSDAKELPAGGEVKTGAYILLKNTLANGSLTIPAGADVVIDLNNKTLSTEGENWGAAPKMDALIVVENGGKLTIKNDGVVDGGEAIAVKMTKANSDNSEVAELVVNGGTIKSKWFAISGNGNEGRSNTKVTINGGEIVSTESAAIYQPQAGEMTINGGTIKGVDSAVEVRDGSLTVNGGNLISTSEPSNYTANGSGTTTDGCVLAIAPHSKDGNIKLNVDIKGGVFDGYYAVRGNDDNGALTYDLNLNVEGGKFICSSKEAVTTAISLMYLKNLGKENWKVVKGGSFNKLKSEYVAKGYKLKEDGSVLKVVEE